MLFVDDITPSSPPTTTEHTTITMHTLNDMQDAKLSILAAIPEKLRKLTVRTQLTPPHTLSPALIQLDATIQLQLGRGSPTAQEGCAQYWFMA